MEMLNRDDDYSTGLAEFWSEDDWKDRAYRYAGYLWDDYGVAVDFIHVDEFAVSVEAPELPQFHGKEYPYLDDAFDAIQSFLETV